MKVIIHVKNVPVINKCVPNSRASKYMKKNWTELKIIATTRHLRVF